MNAPQERGNENIMRVQLLVLFNEIMKGTANEETYARYRVAVKFLPEEAREAWMQVEQIAQRISETNEDPETLHASEREEIQKLKDAIDTVATDLETHVATFDPETYEAYMDALREENVDKEDAILAKWATLHSQAIIEGTVD